MKRACALLGRICDSVIRRQSSTLRRHFIEPLEQRNYLAAYLGWENPPGDGVAGQQVDLQDAWAISDHPETATIDWGDGTQSTFDSVTQEEADNNGWPWNEFLHTYSQSGNYTLALSMPGANPQTSEVTVRYDPSNLYLSADNFHDVGEADIFTAGNQQSPDDQNTYVLNDISSNSLFVASGYPVFNPGDAPAGEVAFTHRGNMQVSGHIKVIGYEGWSEVISDPFTTWVDIQNVAPYATISSEANEDGTTTVSLGNQSDASGISSLKYSFAEKLR